MSVAHLPVSSKNSSFPQSSAACHPSPHPPPEHPAAVVAVYESHPQHFRIPFWRLSAAKASTATLSAYSQSTLRFHSPIPLQYSLPKQTWIHPFHSILSELPLPLHSASPIPESSVRHISLVHAPHGCSTPNRRRFPSVIPNNPTVNISAFRAIDNA